MNTNGNDKLRNALSQRGEVMSDSQLDFAAMQREAKGIRRRRRIGTGVAAAAVLAIIAVPTTLVLNDTREDGSPDPAGRTTQGPDHTKAPDGKGSDKATDEHLADDKSAAEQALEDLPTGDPLAVEYLYDGTIHLREGDEVPAPATTADITSLAGYHGGWLVAENDPTDDHVDSTIRQYDGSGSEVSAVPGNSELAISNDGTQLAWWTWNVEKKVGELHSSGAAGMGEGDGAVQKTGDATYVVPIGYLSTGELVYQASLEGEGASIKATDLNGNVRDIGSLLSVMSTDQINDRIAGQAPGDGTTARVVDGQSGDEIWHKDGWMLGAFSPDGNYVIGFSGGAEPLKISILDASDGSVVSTVDLLGDHGLGYTDVVWNDDSSLAINAFVFAGTDAEPHAGAVLTFDTDGDLTRATDVDPGTESWIFLPRP